MPSLARTLCGRMLLPGLVLASRHLAHRLQEEQGATKLGINPQCSHPSGSLPWPPCWQQLAKPLVPRHPNEPGPMPWLCPSPGPRGISILSTHTVSPCPHPRALPGTAHQRGPQVVGCQGCASTVTQPHVYQTPNGRFLPGEVVVVLVIRGLLLLLVPGRAIESSHPGKGRCRVLLDRPCAVLFQHGLSLPWDAPSCPGRAAHGQCPVEQVMACPSATGLPRRLLPVMGCHQLRGVL